MKKQLPEIQVQIFMDFVKHTVIRKHIKLLDNDSTCPNYFHCSEFNEHLILGFFNQHKTTKIGAQQIIKRGRLVFRKFIFL